jgi:hypothetical protein
VFKIFQISGVNLDFRGVKKRQGGWGKKFSLLLVEINPIIFSFTTVLHFYSGFGFGFGFGFRWILA